MMSSTKSDGKLRGFAALTAQFTKPGRSGGRAASGNGPVNVSAALTRAAGKPLSGSELCAHALALGLWKTSAANPIQSFVHPLSSDVLKEDGSAKLAKPEPGFYTATDDAEILPMKRTNVDPATGYVAVEDVDTEERPINDFLENVYYPCIADGTFTRISVSDLPIA